LDYNICLYLDVSPCVHSFSTKYDVLRK